MVDVTPWPLYPRGKNLYFLYRGLGGPRDRSGRVEKIYSPTGFKPRTAQTVASRLTEYAINCLRTRFNPF